MSTNGAQPTSLRKNHGANHSYWIDGAKVPGVTTILNAGFPKPALINWAAETTAGYAVDHWPELGELSYSKRLKQLMRARFDVQDEAKLRGTRVHKYAHQLAPPPFGTGEDVEVPDEYIGHVDNYLAFVRDWQPREIAVERPVFSRRRRYGGTPDLIAELLDGRTWLLDWKTSEKGVFLENVLQLAALRFADYMLDEDGREVPLPPIDAAGIVNVRADGYDLVPVEATEDAFRLFLCVRAVARFIEQKENWIGEAITPSEAVAR